MDTQSPIGASIDRRALLVAAGGLALSGCTSWPDIRIWPTQTGLAPYSDAHMHLFNASDLPIRGFLRHVVIRERIGDQHQAVQGLVDHFAEVIKPWAVSVDAEQRAYRSLRKHEITVSPATYGDAAARHTIERLGGSLVSGQFLEPTDERLAESHIELAQLVVSQYGDGLPLTTTDEVGDAYQQLRTSFERLAEAALSQTQDANTASLAELSTSDSEIIRTLKWGVLMLQSRTYHLKRYLEGQTPEATRPSLIVNHLVDYDRWLNDSPSTQSSFEKQFRLWSRVRDRYRENVDLRTFAGFCPLKQAHDRRLGRRQSHLDQIKSAYERGDIAGVKLYPPMGFRALGNDRRAWPADFQARDGVGDRIVRDWRSAANPASAPEHLGRALDDALRELYAWAGGQVPVLAHAGPSNAPGHGFEENANPIHWLTATREFPDLRLTLGHFVSNAVTFIHDMETDSESSLWALGATRELIRDRDGRRSSVFVDISYTEELLAEEAQANDYPTRFFRELKRYCLGDDGDGPDPDMSQIVFGSDWIMLGMEPRHQQYLEIIRDGMEAANWHPDEIERVCYGNTRRWLGLT